MGIEVRAVAKYIRGSPEKTKRVVNMVRGKSVTEALSVLKFSTRGAADPVAKAIASAAANAEQNFGLLRDDLFVARICADEAPTLKRGRFGRAGASPLLKRSSHITVVLESRTEAAQ